MKRQRAENNILHCVLSHPKTFVPSCPGKSRMSQTPLASPFTRHGWCILGLLQAFRGSCQRGRWTFKMNCPEVQPSLGSLKDLVMFLVFVFNVGDVVAPRSVKKTHCHQCLADDCLLQHSTRTETVRTDSSLNKQGKRSTAQAQSLQDIISSIFQSNSLNALLRSGNPKPDYSACTNRKFFEKNLSLLIVRF